MSSPSVRPEDRNRSRGQESLAWDGESPAWIRSEAFAEDLGDPGCLGVSLSSAVLRRLPAVPRKPRDAGRWPWLAALSAPVFHPRTA